MEPGLPNNSAKSTAARSLNAPVFVGALYVVGVVPSGRDRVPCADRRSS